MTISLDLAARRVIMSCMLYYGLETPILSDGEFDTLCRRVANEWDDLDEQRRLCLGSPDQIRATGMYVKITALAESGAISWLEKVGLYDPAGSRRPVYTREQSYLEGIGHYRMAGDYTWHVERKKRVSITALDPLTVWTLVA